MSTTYAHRQTTAQKVADSKAASLFDSSSQSESLQRKANMANNATQRAEAPRPNNTGMPDNLKAGIENLSGFSMDDVRVHYNSSKPATVQALAYTQGTDIHVAPGQEKHLPHEAWHVAQQMAGRVSPTTNINGMPVNDNAALEHEADVMGEKAVGQRKGIKSDSTAQNLKTNAETIQRVWIGIDATMDYASYLELYNARKKIMNEFYVQAILKAPYLNSAGEPDIKAKEDDFVPKSNTELNWGDIIISCVSDSGSAFLNGAVDERRLKVQMNLEACKSAYFVDDEEEQKQDLIEKGKKGIETRLKDRKDANKNYESDVIASILLHELGHAYQHYLVIKHKNDPKYTSLQEMMDGDPNLKSYFTELTRYPMLMDAIINKDENRLHTALECYNSKIDNIDDIVGGLTSDKPTKESLDSIISILENITETNDNAPMNESSATYWDKDADNLFMNEIPYHTNGLHGKIGVRKKYEDLVCKESIANYAIFKQSADDIRAIDKYISDTDSPDKIWEIISCDRYKNISKNKQEKLIKKLAELGKKNNSPPPLNYNSWANFINRPDKYVGNHELVKQIWMLVYPPMLPQQPTPTTSANPPKPPKPPKLPPSPSTKT